MLMRNLGLLKYEPRLRLWLNKAHVSREKAHFKPKLFLFAARAKTTYL